MPFEPGSTYARSSLVGSGPINLVCWHKSWSSSVLTHESVICSQFCLCNSGEVSPGKPLGMEVVGMEPLHGTYDQHAWSKVHLWPHLRVRDLTQGGPGASIATPKLGYPLLMAQGRTCVAIRSHRVMSSPSRLRVWACPTGPPLLGRCHRVPC